MFEYPNYSDRYNKYSLEVLYKLGNLATLSDILRLVILYKEGGIYIDCDNTFKGQHIKYNIKYSKILINIISVQIVNLVYILFII
ncbi:tcdA/TcdB catalytic glycosyltransferase domain protein [Francisella tularensis]|nr:tcdA/TcdB catalytic glycosyltransferase domain protein [Francisella tularensis]